MRRSCGPQLTIEPEQEDNEELNIIGVKKKEEKEKGYKLVVLVSSSQIIVYHSFTDMWAPSLRGGNRVRVLFYEVLVWSQ